MYNIIKASEWKKTKWSGGESNEIFIYPEGSSYAKQDFKMRLSIATCEKEEKTNFTYLPGTSRFIAKLDGDLYISHYGRYDTDLSKYEIERFAGDWRTSSYGKYRDFNLMLKDVRGDLYFSDVSKEITLSLQEGASLTFLFVLEGTVEIIGQDIVLEKNDLIVSDFHKFHLNSNNAKVFYGFAKEWEK